MAFQLNEFTAVLGRHGIAKASSFAVVLSPPAALKSEIINDIPLLCDSASVPGISFQTDETKYMGYGLVEKRPSAVAYDDITLTLIGDGRGRVHEMMRKWLALVANIDGTAQTAYGINQGFFNFPDQYWGTIDLYLYDVAANNYDHLIFDKAYPTGIGPTELGWANVDTLMSIPVIFTYRSYSSKNLASIRSSATPVNSVTGTNSRTLDDLENLMTKPNLQQYQQRFDTMNTVPPVDNSTGIEV